MRFVIVLTLIIGTALAVPLHQQRIVGGEPTTIDQYPYMSNMQFGWFGIIWFQACGGSLLTSRTILSAAHCYHGDPASSWNVRLGTSLASSGGDLHTVQQLINHPNYNPNTLEYDVSVVVLHTAAVFSSNIGVARIPGTTYNLPAGTDVTSIGWGALSSGGSSPEQLQHVVIQIIDQDICAERYAYLKTQPGFQGWPDITDGMVCAGVLDVGGKDACQGDSGGPLAHLGDIVYGVTSWGYGCAHEFYPGVNARVSHYSQWIVDNASI